MRFAVLTMNPGIDRVLYFREPMRPGKMNRAYRSVTSQGSKGANVAILGSMSIIPLPEDITESSRRIS